MKNVSDAWYWSLNLAGDSLIGGLLLIYAMTGAPGALTAFQVWTWVLVFCGFIVGAAADRTSFRPRPTGFLIYHVVSEVAFVTATAWFGMPVLAAARLITVLMAESARERDPDAKEPA